jgi:membrane protein required for colicin V production
MSVLDIVLIIPLLWFGFKGFKNGIIIEIASLLAFIVAAYLAFKFSCYVTQQLNLHGFTGRLLPLLAIIITFIAAYLLIKASSKLLDKLAKALALGILTRIGGLFFGLLKAFFFAGLLLMLIENFDTNKNLVKEEEKKQSYLYYPMYKTAAFLLPEIKELVKEVPR